MSDTSTFERGLPKNNDFYYTEEELKTYCNQKFLKKVDNELIFKKKLTSEDKRELSDDQKKLRRSIMTSISQKRYALANPDVAKRRVQNLKKKSLAAT